MNDHTLLLRQIHPNWIKQNRVTSQVFQPTPKDENKLSVYDGDKITAENAFRHYTEQLRFRSAGVLAVSVCECNELCLPAQADPTPFPEHAIIDFSHYSKSEQESKAKILRSFAVQRGWKYSSQ
ncbi:MAG: hypothetical protein FDX18_04240 [Chlorobium sp.]|nr:MAG: hypothetical protein FDX18_04240 [Chlorobium sp.]